MSIEHVFWKGVVYTGIFANAILGDDDRFGFVGVGRGLFFLVFGPGKIWDS